MPFSVRLRALITRVGSFALAGVLLWLALRGVDLRTVGADLAAGDYRWLVPIIAVSLAAHAVRAWRWRLLLAGLPDARPPSFGLAFAAVMMGYGVNYVLPRAGEFVRTGVVSRGTGTPYAAVLGTVALDRILDMGMLALGLVTVPFLLRDRLEPLVRLFAAPLRDRFATLPGGLLLVLLAVVVVAGVAGGLWWHARRRQAAAEATSAPGRVRRLVQSFAGGLSALAHAPRRGTLVGLTVVMWALYLGMAYLPFLLLRTAEPYSLSLADGWCIMLLGSLGMVVPSPGGAGSFHYVTILTLTEIWAVGREDAATYAVLAHAAQLVVYAVTGALCFLALSFRRADTGGENGSAPPWNASRAPKDGSDVPV